MAAEAGFGLRTGETGSHGSGDVEGRRTITHRLSTVGIRLQAFLLILALGAACSSGADTVPRAALAPDLTADQHRWVEHTLASMTVRRKAAQMLMVWIGGGYTSTDSWEFHQLLDWVERQGVGGVQLGSGLPHTYAAKLNQLQRRSRIPLLVASDLEGGAGSRMGGIHALPSFSSQGGATLFPPSMAFGAARSEELAYELGRITGVEARAVGIHVAFGPVLDVRSDSASPAIGTRAFGDDPALVARLGSAFIRGAHAGGLLTVGKHFPGHGGVSADSHVDLPVSWAGRARLDSVELVPFRAAVESGVDGIMTAHIAMRGLEGARAGPATLSPLVLRLLRKDLGFDGLVFTDAMEMSAVTARVGTTEAVLLAVEAGVDVVLTPPNGRDVIDAITRAVQGGRISEERLDASVRRILRAKARLGLPDSRDVNLETVSDIVGTRAHARVADRVAQRSITLARDDRGVVPLPTSARRILVVALATRGDPSAGRVFVRTLERFGGSRRIFSVSVSDSIRPDEVRAIVRMADSADVICLAAHSPPPTRTGAPGSSAGIVSLARQLSRRGAPVVLISFIDPARVRSLSPEATHLVAWGPGEASEKAAARALLGMAPITGRLPISLSPESPFGHGLSRRFVRRSARRTADSSSLQSSP